MSFTAGDRVVGGGLILIRTERNLTLHALGAGSGDLIGTFSSAAAAWQALDELDLAELQQLPLAA
jgi:hypothetical protein